MLRFATVVSICLAAGCGVDPVEAGVVGPPPDEVVYRCPTFGCGNENSPDIQGVDFYELNMASTRANPKSNDQGFAIVDFIKNGVSYSLHVKNGKLSGVPVLGATISGAALVGASIIVKNRITGNEYAIRIDDVQPVKYWAKSKANPLLEAYQLDYFAFVGGSLATPYGNLCKHPPGDTGNPDQLTMTSHLAYFTLLFEGERIYQSNRTDNPDLTGEWFNLGCAGGALAKMYLTGHTVVARFDGFTTTQDERTTILKMFSADYCGTGIPFTMAGQPLVWADNHNWMSIDSSTATTTLEARWTPHGVACLSTPRAAISGSPAAAEFPGIDISSIESTCNRTIPACSDTSLNLDGYHLVSANPYLSWPPP